MGMASVLARGGEWVCGFVSDVDGSRSFGTCGLGWVNCWSNVGRIEKGSGPWTICVFATSKYLFLAGEETAQGKTGTGFSVVVPFLHSCPQLQPALLRHRRNTVVFVATISSNN